MISKQFVFFPSGILEITDVSEYVHEFVNNFLRAVHNGVQSERLSKPGLGLHLYLKAGVRNWFKTLENSFGMKFHARTDKRFFTLCLAPTNEISQIST